LKARKMKEIKKWLDSNFVSVKEGLCVK